MYTEEPKGVSGRRRNKGAVIRRTAAAASLAVAGTLWLGAALARPLPDQPLVTGDVREDVVAEAAPAQRGGASVSLRDAVRMASARYKGRVVRAVTVNRGGRPVHEIRILLDDGGRVVTVHVDAQTGQMR